MEWLRSDSWGLNLLFASTSAGVNRSYYGPSYTNTNYLPNIYTQPPLWAYFGPLVEMGISLLLYMIVVMRIL